MKIGRCYLTYSKVRRCLAACLIDDGLRVDLFEARHIAPHEIPDLRNENNEDLMEVQVDFREHRRIVLIADG